MLKIKNLVRKFFLRKDETIFDFILKDIHDTDLNLNAFRGKKILLVNIASQCGLTQQLELLEKLYKKYQEQNFHIIAIPSNDFGGQEPLTDEKIITFCKSNYSVSFTLLKKSKVLGTEIHPIYKMLKNLGYTPQWNFHKYLFNENGILISEFEPGTNPFDENLLKHLEH